MSPRLTSGWTDLHATLFLALTALGLSAYLIAQRPPVVALVLFALLAGVVLGASFTDAMGGLVAGVAGGAVSLAFQGFAGHLIGHPFATAAGEFALLIVLGGSVGTAMDRIHRSKRISARITDQAVSSSVGSLGLLTAEDADYRLHEEQVRAEIHDRPLSCARITVDFIQDDLTPEERRRAIRAVARVIETDLRATDIPYAVDDEVIGVILPETPHTTARDVIESTLMLARTNTFADRTHHERRAVDDVAVVTAEVTAVHQVTSETETSGDTGDRNPAR